MSAPPPDLSVVIVHYNTPGDLDVCLRSLYEHTRGITFEVLVVDNASPDRGVDDVMSRYPQATYIRSAANLGFPGGNNLALRQARGRLLLLLNPDTYLLDDALTELVRFMDEGGAGVCGPRCVDVDGRVQVDGVRFPALWDYFCQATGLAAAFPDHPLLGRYEQTWWDRGDTREVDWVPGAALMIRRDVMERIGLLDEEIFMFAEDIDWCWRARRAGYTVMLHGEATIVHHYGRSATQHMDRRVVNTHVGKMILFRKHASPLDRVGLRALFVAEAAAKAPLAAALGLLRRDPAKAATARGYLRVAAIAAGLRPVGKA